MTIYARISFDDKHHDTIEVRGSRIKEHLYESLPTEYIFRGSFDENSVNEVLEKIKPGELYMDSYTLNRFTYGFYKKYHKVLIEEFYEAD